jgi:hypothetical protein
MTTYSASVSRAGVVPADGSFVILGSSGQSITVGANQKLVGSLSATGFSVDNADLKFSICYQTAAGAITTLSSPAQQSITGQVFTNGLTANAAGSPPAGTYTVGFCAAQVNGTAAITYEAVIAGWVLLTN